MTRVGLWPKLLTGAVTGGPLTRNDMNDSTAVHKWKAWKTCVRRSGPCLVTLGLVLALIGALEFLTTFGVSHPLRLAWCCLIGMPILLTGIFVCEFASPKRPRLPANHTDTERSG